MPLTDVRIRSAAPAATITKLSDGEGLQLWVMPTGAKVWKLAYRFLGKQKTLTIGPYPVVTLLEARRAKDAARRQMAAGADPAAQKQIDKLTRRIAAENTFSAVAAELLAKKKREGKSESTLFKVGWMHGIAAGTIGDRPIADITAPEILKVLRDVEARGNLETAKRIRSVIGEVFRYAIATARATSDPTQSLKGATAAPAVRHRSALTDPRDVGALMRAIDAFRGQATTRAALQLMAYLFPRPGELRLATWPEFDLEAAVWTVPEERMKMRRPHKVPLPRQALTVLAELHRITGYGALVFPGVGMSGGAGRKVEPRPISDGTLNVALRRLGYTTDEMQPHGFRGMASTLLNESGLFPGDVIEAALAHQETDAVRRAYNRASYWKERVAMAQWYADHLDELRDGAKVMPFRRSGS